MAYTSSGFSDLGAVQGMGEGAPDPAEQSLDLLGATLHQGTRIGQHRA